MKEKFEELVIETIRFESEDVISESTSCPELPLIPVNQG